MERSQGRMGCTRNSKFKSSLTDAQTLRTAASITIVYGQTTMNQTASNPWRALVSIQNCPQRNKNQDQPLPKPTDKLLERYLYF